MDTDLTPEWQEKVLFVDDDPLVLASIVRQFRRRFNLETAAGVPEAMVTLRTKGPFAVVVSDLRMPAVDGIQFFSRLLQASPDTIRILLTGHAGLETVIDAINQGNIFRFLTKPCPQPVLEAAVVAALRQYRLVTAERVLLEQTVNGMITVLNEVLGVANPAAFNRANRVRRLMSRLAEILQPRERWAWEAAGSLSLLGCIALAPETLDKLFQNIPLTLAEHQLFMNHPGVASSLIGSVPRLEKVAEIVAHQELPANSGGQISLGARALKAALDYDLHWIRMDDPSFSRIIQRMREREGWYEPRVLEALEQVARLEQEGEEKSLEIASLRRNMILREDIVTVSDVLLVSKGEVVTQAMLERLRLFRASVGIQEPVRVFVPTERR